MLLLYDAYGVPHQLIHTRKFAPFSSVSSESWMKSADFEVGTDIQNFPVKAGAKALTML